MRGPLRLAAALAALTTGAVVGCYSDDFLLGAYCTHEEQCGDEQCCAGQRCRPSPTDCILSEQDINSPFTPAYEPCEDDDECQTHGLPRCVRLYGAEVGFCADICVAGPGNCTPEEVEPLPRVCITYNDQQVCALDCSATDRCPDTMTCRTGVCVAKS